MKAKGFKRHWSRTKKIQLGQVQPRRFVYNIVLSAIIFTLGLVLMVAPENLGFDLSGLSQYYGWQGEKWLGVILISYGLLRGFIYWRRWRQRV